MDADTRRAQEALVDQEHVYNARVRARAPLVWWATLVGPFAATALVLGLLWALVGGAYVRRLVATGVLTVFLLGRFVILGGEDPGARDALRFFSRFELLLMVLWLDLMTACVLAFHCGFLFKVPWIGKRLAGLVEDGRLILALHPWMRRATFAGLVAFVMFPLAATGSVGGSIFGRLLGLSRSATFAAVVLGSALGAGVMYLGAGVLNRYLNRDDPWMLAGGAAVIIGVIVLLNYRYQRMKRDALARVDDLDRARRPHGHSR